VSLRENISEKIAVTVASGVVIFLLNWVWEIDKNQDSRNQQNIQEIADLKSKLFAAFGTIQEVEERSKESEITSKVNKEMRLLLQQVLASQDPDYLRDKLEREYERRKHLHLQQQQEQLQMLHPDAAPPEIEAEPNDSVTEEIVIEQDPVTENPAQQQEEPVHRQRISVDQYIEQKIRRHKK